MHVPLKLINNLHMKMGYCQKPKKKKQPDGQQTKKPNKQKHAWKRKIIKEYTKRVGLPGEQ